MAKTLDEIRKKLQALESRKNPSNFSGGDKLTYAHWNMQKEHRQSFDSFQTQTRTTHFSG